MLSIDTYVKGNVPYESSLSFNFIYLLGVSSAFSENISSLSRLLRILLGMFQSRKLITVGRGEQSGRWGAGQSPARHRGYRLQVRGGIDRWVDNG